MVWNQAGPDRIIGHSGNWVGSDMAVIFLISVVVAVIAVIVLVIAPVRHTEAVARRFYWSRVVQPCSRRWVKRRSKKKPTGEVRHLVVKNANDPERRRYVYEEAVWRNTQRLEKSGYSQDNVQWPMFSPRPDEKVRRRRAVYKATFTAEAGHSCTAKIRFERWQALRQDQRYRLGRNAFGRVRSIQAATAPIDQDRVKAGQDRVKADQNRGKAAQDRTESAEQNL